MRVPTTLLGATILTLMTVTALDAEAFCRLRTCDPEKADCQTNARGCVTDGEPLFYAPHCVSFAVSRGDAESVGFTDDEFLDIVKEAFDRWASVDCGGKERPGFEFASAGVVDAEGKFFCETSPELNISVWELTPDWKHQSTSLGYTTSTYEIEQGEVFDSDVELNLGKILNSSFPIAAMRPVLLSIITHEAGHFLGLAHSDDPDAVMAASYNNRDLLERPLTEDDIAGICAVFPPDEAPKACPVPGVSEAALNLEACEESGKPPDGSASCHVAGVGGSSTGGSPWLLGLLGLGLTLRGRRER